MKDSFLTPPGFHLAERVRKRSIRVNYCNDVMIKDLLLHFCILLFLRLNVRRPCVQTSSSTVC
jgi:hypothetical protein